LIRLLFTWRQKVYLLNARGGFYNVPKVNTRELSVNYMHVVLKNYFSIAVTDEVIIKGHAQDCENAQSIIADGLDKVKTLVAKL